VTENAGSDRVAGSADNDGAGGRADDESEDAAVAAQVNGLWQRKDVKKWTEELSRAHRAFKRGKEWGIEWASLVDKFFDFEAVWGFTDMGGQICITA
jgi:hypothetical protein